MSAITIKKNSGGLTTNSLKVYDDQDTLLQVFLASDKKKGDNQTGRFFNHKIHKPKSSKQILTLGLGTTKDEEEAVAWKTVWHTTKQPTKKVTGYKVDKGTQNNKWTVVTITPDHNYFISRAAFKKDTGATTGALAILAEGPTEVRVFKSDMAKDDALASIEAGEGIASTVDPQTTALGEYLALVIDGEGKAVIDSQKNILGQIASLGSGSKKISPVTVRAFKHADRDKEWTVTIKDSQNKVISTSKFKKNTDGITTKALKLQPGIVNHAFVKMAGGSREIPSPIDLTQETAATLKKKQLEINENGFAYLNENAAEPQP